MKSRRSMRPSPLRFAVACRVVDNYGDAGVALRLARQLAVEHAGEVTLWVDDRASLARILPGLDPRAVDQRQGTIRIRALDDATAPDPLPDVVVEAFGCGLPAPWLDAMSSASRAPVWIVLEHLSAETWVDGVHGLPSPQPRGRLTRWFFFPGFTPATGGLLRERDLFAQRDAFQRNRVARELPWRAAGLPAPPAGALTVSLFCYPNDALPALLDAWRDDDAPVACLIPEGTAAGALDRWFAGAVPHAGETRQVGALTLGVAPFVDQQAFDRRLWGCDLNLVRGEDSFVRAQWAARPFAWHVYPQSDQAHLPKLDALLERYCAGLDAAAENALRRFAQAFAAGSGREAGEAWRPLRAALPALARRACEWADQLAAQPDLATQLVEFCRKRL